MEQQESATRQFARSLNQAQKTPADPYSHAFSVLDSTREKIKELYQLNSKEFKLGNIADDRMMRLWQNDMEYIVFFFQKSIEDPAFIPVFNYIFTYLEMEIGLTRAKNGEERKQQANVGRGYHPVDFSSGVGIQPQEQPHGENMLDGIIGRFRR